MKTLLLLAALAAQLCFAQSPSADCYGYDHDIWRILINTTDASPQVQIDAVIDHTGGTAVYTSGQLTAGVSESRHVSIDTNGSPSYTCTFGIKTITLLEKGGVPFGKRITRYVVRISPSGLNYDPVKWITTTTSTVSGKVRYDIFDTSDTLTGSINATFTGATISGIAFADDGDSFWGTPQ